MQPRALWVASHHAELQGKLPGNWGNLLDGIDQLLIKSINDDSYAKVLLPTSHLLLDASRLAVCSVLRSSRHELWLAANRQAPSGSENIISPCLGTASVRHIHAGTGA